MFLFGCVTLPALAQTTEKVNLLKIFELKDAEKQKRQLVIDIPRYLNGIKTDDLDGAIAELNDLIVQYKIDDAKGMSLLIDAQRLVQLKQPGAADSVLKKAIKQAFDNDDHYLLYACFTRIAFIRLAQGNFMQTILNYGQAKKEATKLNDPYLQVLIDINISDSYYKNSLYEQALFYLTEAQSLINKNNIQDQKVKNSVWLNIAELYFRINKIGPVKKYNRLLHEAPKGDNRLYSFTQRTGYYITFLQQNYLQVIDRLNELKHDTAYVFDNVIDEQNLADAYFLSGQNDAARAILTQMIKDPGQNNHPEIKQHLYEELAQIAEDEDNAKLANYNYKMSLDQAKEQLHRLIDVGSASSQITIEQMQLGYDKKEAGYRSKQALLTFAVIVTVLTLIIGGMLYRNIRQKRYYERILFESKKQELAFINSHEVRKHLSNILGIVNMIKQSTDKHEEYLQAEDHLMRAAEDLDKAIKNISEKLDS